MNSAHRWPICISSGFQFAGSISISWPPRSSPLETPLPRGIKRFSPLGNRASQSGPDHFFGATGPADVLLRFVNRDREVVAASVSIRRGARRTPRNPVPPDLPPHLNVIQDLKPYALCRKLPARRRHEFLLLRLSILPQLPEQCVQLFLRKLPDPFEKFQLVVEVVVCAVEPEPRADRPVNSERPADGITEVAILKFVMFREYLDSLGRACSLYRDTELRSQAGDQQPALSGEERLCSEYPQVRAPPALFQCRLNFLLLKFPLQLAQMFERFLVVAVHGNPLAPLGRRIHCIDAER